MLLPLARSLAPLGYTRAAAPAPYSPADEGGLVLWVDTPDYGSAYYQDSAGTTPATADSAPVARWTGAGGTSVHLVQSGATGLRPLLRTGANGINGMHKIKFDGTDDFLLSSASLTFTTAFTFWAIVQAPNLDKLRIWCSYNNLNLYLGHDHNNLTYFYTGNTSSDDQLNVSQADDSYYVVIGDYNGSVKTSAVNGGSYVSESVTGSLGISGPLYFGKYGGGATFEWGGSIVCCGMHNTVLSSAAKTRIREWLIGRANTWTTDRLVCAGDSLTRGFGLASPATQSYPAQTITELSGLGYTYAVSNLGVDSRTLATMVTQAASEVDPLYDTYRQRNLAVLWGGTNDLQFDSAVTAATLKGYYETWGNGRFTAGFERVVLLDMIPRTDAGTGQATHETRRQAFNALLAADFNVATANPYVWLPASGITYGSVLVKVSEIPELQNTGGAYYQGDGVHLNSAGAGLVADAAAAAAVAVRG